MCLHHLYCLNKKQNFLWNQPELVAYTMRLHTCVPYVLTHKKYISYIYQISPPLLVLFFIFFIYLSYNKKNKKQKNQQSHINSTILQLNIKLRLLFVVFTRSIMYVYMQASKSKVIFFYCLTVLLYKILQYCMFNPYVATYLLAFYLMT